MTPRPVDQLFAGRIEAFREQRCRRCGVEVKEFRDELSRHEYTLSALCQECQDFAFQPLDEAS